jgi:hypothetical protein
MARPPEVLETRDEGLLKLFFAGAIEPKRAAEIARERAAASRAKAEQLRFIERHIDATANPADGPSAKPDAGSLLVLRYGIEASEWTAKFFERAADDLESEQSAAVSTARGR